MLTGGEGRRLGGIDKALIDVGGRRLIDCAMARAASWGAPIVVSARTAKPWHAKLEISIVLDRPDCVGPLAGVTAVFAGAGLDVDVVVTVTVDCPNLPADLVERLVTAAAESGKIAVAESESGQHHLIAAWPRISFAAVRAAVDSGVVSVHRAQACHGTVAVSWRGVDPDPFLNLNTPADVERWVRRPS